MTVATETLPLLENGDNLTREEFHRLYELRPDIKKAELIDGVVYVASPTHNKRHGKPHGVLTTWIGTYALGRPEIDFADNATLIIGDDDEVQPDVMLYFLPPHETNAKQTDDDYVEGAPELVIEVSASSVSYDLHQKKRLYERAGVQEYLIWRTVSQAFDWFDLQNGVYVARQPDAQGMIPSRLFPGLRLPVAKLLAGDYAAILAAVAPSPTKGGTE